MSKKLLDGRQSGKVIQTGPDRHIDFAFYDRVWVHHIGNTQGDQVRRLGRWLGVAHRVGSRLCYWILLGTGKVIAFATVQHLTQSEHPIATSELDRGLRREIKSQT